MTHENQPVRRVQARVYRPVGGALWLGPAIGLGFGLCALLAIGLLIGARPQSTDLSASALRPTAILATITPSPVIPTATSRPTPAPSPTPQGLYIGGAGGGSGPGPTRALRRA